MRFPTARATATALLRRRIIASGQAGLMRPRPARVSAPRSGFAGFRFPPEVILVLAPEHDDASPQPAWILSSTDATDPTGLVGIYTDPKHIIVYTSDGEARQEFSVLFTARPTGGTPAPSSESREVLWVPREQILGLNMDRSMRMRVQHYLDARPKPYLG